MFKVDEKRSATLSATRQLIEIATSQNTTNHLRKARGMAAQLNIAQLQGFKRAFDLAHRCDPRATRASCILFGVHTDALMTNA